MYCPRCATPHADDIKFCRSCGLGLEAVALVLSGKPAQPTKVSKKKNQPNTSEDWLEKRIEGVKGVTTGTTLIAVSLLIGLALALFVPGEVPWMLVWIVFFGWMAVWGGIELASGIGNMLESKSRLRLMGLAGSKASAIDSTHQQLSSAAGEPQMLTNSSAPFRSSPPLSVSEGTTRQLDNLVEK